jgi:hypothetical protein
VTGAEPPADPVPPGGLSWDERRRHAIASHAAERERRRAAEAGQARDLLADFVRTATARGLAPAPLVARSYDGRTSYRTGLRGWYLTPDRTVAVGTDGGYYVLSVPASLRARFTGATIEPSEPRLVVGEGGRDGESIPLAALLRRLLSDLD